MVPLPLHGLIRLGTASITSLAALAMVIAQPSGNAADEKKPTPPEVDEGEPAPAPTTKPDTAKPPIAPTESKPAPGVDAPPEQETSNQFPTGSRERPLVVRTFLPNLIEDPAVFAEHQVRASAAGDNGAAGRDNDALTEPEQGLPAAIAVSFGKDLSIAWDTVECRWLYAWRGGFLDMGDSWEAGSDVPPEESASLSKIIGDLDYLASGPAPLSVSIGSGPVKFYGYRLVDGVPEFLYTVGRLKVAERLQPGDDGETIVQHFSVERQTLDLMLSAPSQDSAEGEGDHDGKESTEPEDSVTVIDGTRRGDYVLVSGKNAGDFTLVHQIGAAPPPAVTPKVPAAGPIPLLTQSDSGKAPGSEKTMPSEPKSDGPPSTAPSPEPKPKTPTEPEPKDDTKAPAKPDSMPKPVPKARPVALTPTEPAPKAKEPEHIIAKAERYDREIPLSAPQLEQGAMKPASLAFADRDFKFAELPEELIGADYVRTYDRDKYIPGDILNYRLKLEADATVYLLFDSRLEPLPEWTNNRFVDTGKTASLDSEIEFRILRGNAEAGELRLGPQDSGAGAHFYIIAATPRATATAPEKSE